MSTSFCTSRRDSFADSKSLFKRVVAKYVDCKSLPTVCAVDSDADNPSKSRRMSPNTIHYAVDVEHATVAALQNDSILEAGWFALAQEKPCDGNTARKVITSCAKLYATRGLDPGIYFRHLRCGSIDRRTA
jgi:hypothetical protein